LLRLLLCNAGHYFALHLPSARFPIIAATPTAQGCRRIGLVKILFTSTPKFHTNPPNGNLFHSVPALRVRCRGSRRLISGRRAVLCPFHCPVPRTVSSIVCISKVLLVESICLDTEKYLFQILIPVDSLSTSSVDISHFERYQPTLYDFYLNLHLVSNNFVFSLYIVKFFNAFKYFLSSWMILWKNFF
jgi:hypothetical protein